MNIRCKWEETVEPFSKLVWLGREGGGRGVMGGQMIDIIFKNLKILKSIIWSGVRRDSKIWAINFNLMNDVIGDDCNKDQTDI